MLQPTQGAHILRVWIMAIFGLALSFALGFSTSGTTMVYCCLLELYCKTKKQATATFFQRLRIQFFGVPIVTAIQFLLFLTPLPTQIRLLLGAATALLLQLTLNDKLKLGLTEISQVVIVALITTTFETTRLYFVRRLFLTTLGITLCYLFFTYLLPTRYDKGYEVAVARLRDCADNAFLGMAERLPAVATALAETNGFLTIVSDDLYVKPQYQGYRASVPVLQWELRLISAMHALQLCATALPAGSRLGEEMLPYLRCFWQEVMRARGDSFLRYRVTEPAFILLMRMDSTEDLKLAYHCNALLEVAKAVPTIPPNCSAVEALTT